MKYSGLCLILFLTLISDSVFSDENRYEDPFENIKIESTSRSSFEVNADWFSYWQENELSDEFYLNPGVFQFAEQQYNQGLQLDLKLPINENIKVFSSGLYEVEDKDIAESKEKESTMLEAFVEMSTTQQDWGMSFGRKKIQWSQGFNWSPANVLQPFFDRPSYDRDDRQQLKGWDLVEVTQRFNDSSWTLLATDVIENSLDPAIEQRHQYALRYSVEKPVDMSFILHKVEGHKINAAATWSQLISDSTTVKADGSYMNRRELPESLANWNFSEQGFHKSVLGINYAIQEWDISLEYLYNAHGYTDREWDRITDQLDQANENINNGSDIGSSIEQLTKMLLLLNNGQLRQNYVYLMFANSRIDQLFQYRLSNQYNVDDESQIFRVELLQNWTSHFSSRLEWQNFTGCEQCEYGMTPDAETFRVSFYYLF